MRRRLAYLALQCLHEFQQVHELVSRKRHRSFHDSRRFATSENDVPQNFCMHSTCSHLAITSRQPIPPREVAVLVVTLCSVCVDFALELLASGASTHIVCWSCALVYAPVGNKETIARRGLQSTPSNTSNRAQRMSTSTQTY